MVLTNAANILGGEKVLHRPIRSQMDVIELISKGIPKNALMNLVKYLGITTHQIAALLPVTERTIQRYTPNQHFNSVVSEHILQIAELAAKGAEVFDSKEQFRLWLSLPNKALGNKTPLSMMNTKRGSDMVMDILVRIEHGVYS